MTFLWVILILVAIGVVASLISQSMPARTRVVERVRSPREYVEEEEVVVERRPRRRRVVR
jgi:hypothetical protein